MVKYAEVSGTTGNDQIGDYTYLDLYYPVRVNIPYQENQGIYPRETQILICNGEKTKKMQVGLELGFLSDRLLINSTYSRNRSSNQLTFNTSLHNRARRNYKKFSSNSSKFEFLNLS